MINSVIISTQLAYLASTGILPAFDHASRVTGVDRNLLLAIASRESNMGLALDEHWLGDRAGCGPVGCGMGIMQIDRRYHPQFAENIAPNNHRANVLKAAQILSQNGDHFGANIKAAIAAYNAGIGGVQSVMRNGMDPDAATTGGDYASDVLARYNTLKTMGGSNARPEEGLKDLAAITLLGITGITFSIKAK